MTVICDDDGIRVEDNLEEYGFIVPPRSRGHREGDSEVASEPNGGGLSGDWSRVSNYI